MIFADSITHFVLIFSIQAVDSDENCGPKVEAIKQYPFSFLSHMAR